MLFLTSLAYALLFPLLALTLPQLARVVAPGMHGLVLAGMHLSAYAIILLLVRVLRLAWEDIGDKSGSHERLVRAFLDV